MSEDKIREQLYLDYGRFNGIVGNYNTIKSMNKGKWKELLELRFLSPKLYEDYANGTSEEELKHDFFNFSKLVNKVRTEITNDGKPSTAGLLAFRYAYEIVNDIQAWSLPQNGENLNLRHKFGASFALENHDMANEIEQWIKKNCNE